MRASLLPLLCFGSLVATASLPACTPSSNLTIVRLAPGEQPPVRGTGVKLKRTGEESFARAKAGFFAVRTPEDWDHAWSAGEAPPMPKLKGGQEMLLLAVGQSSALSRIRVDRAVETGTAFYVWVRETTVGEHCVPRKERPFDAVVGMYTHKPIRVFLERERGESCGEPPAAQVLCRRAGAEDWSDSIQGQPGDTVECSLNASAEGTFELVDRLLTIGDLPAGSAAKLAFRKGPALAELELDVYGTYVLSGEAADEAGRRGTATASIEAKPPKTKDVLVQLVWAGFDRADDPETFPRANLRVAEEGPTGQRCTAEIPVPGLCDVKTRGSYTYMRIPAGSRSLPVSVQYLDERAAKGPGPCIHVWFDGVRTAETCERAPREAEEIWHVGVLDTATGKLVDTGAGDAAPAGASAPSAETGAP